MADTWKVTVTFEKVVNLPPVEERQYPDCPQAEALMLAEKELGITPGDNSFRRGEMVFVPELPVPMDPS